MKYFSMNGQINKELFERFIPFYNEHSLSDCVIVLSTAGGDSYISETLIHMINEMPKAMLLIHAVYSAGFEIAYKVKCKKLLSKTAKGMWHYARADISLNTKGKPYYKEDDCVILNLPIEKKQQETFAKKIMTPKEYKQFSKDDDVYFDFKRMKEIFPDAEII